VDDDGVKWQVTEGHRPTKIRQLKLEGEDKERDGAGYTVEERLRDHARGWGADPGMEGTGYAQI